MESGKLPRCGGGCGGLGLALSEKFNLKDFDYTNLDIDVDAIKIGKKMVSWATHIAGDLTSLDNRGKYDYVALIDWFAQIRNWKAALSQLIDKTNRFVNFGANVRMTGSTVIDEDVSYVYYLDSGTRVIEITHNIYEIINYLCHHEYKVKKINFYGYSSKKSFSAFRHLPRKECIQGNFEIEIYGENGWIEFSKYHKLGGISNELLNHLGPTFRPLKPLIKVVVDNNEIEV